MPIRKDDPLINSPEELAPEALATLRAIMRGHVQDAQPKDVIANKKLRLEAAKLILSKCWPDKKVETHVNANLAEMARALGMDPAKITERAAVLDGQLGMGGKLEQAVKDVRAGAASPRPAELPDAPARLQGMTTQPARSRGRAGPVKPPGPGASDG